MQAVLIIVMTIGLVGCEGDEQKNQRIQAEAQRMAKVDRCEAAKARVIAETDALIESGRKWTDADVTRWEGMVLGCE